MSIEFKEYSKNYDILLEYSKPYKEILHRTTEFLKLHNPDFSADLNILDIGSGTGNFSMVVSKLYPNAHIDIIEPSIEMLAIAKNKLKSNYKINYYNQELEGFKINKQYDIILCFHCLYLMKDRGAQIIKMRDLLKIDGNLFICDIGKEINVRDWKIYFLKDFYKSYGLLKTLNLFFKGRSITKTNKEIQNKQKSGILWQHTLDQFKSKFKLNFQIRESITCYRGISNYIVCSKIVK